MSHLMVEGLSWMELAVQSLDSNKATASKKISKSRKVA